MTLNSFFNLKSKYNITTWFFLSKKRKPERQKQNLKPELERQKQNLKPEPERRKQKPEERHRHPPFPNWHVYVSHTAT
jgi:hypothetical protein